MTAAELAALHRIPQHAWIRATLGLVTQGCWRGQRLGRSPQAVGMNFKSNDQPYEVAPGFAAAWKKARGLS